MASEFSGFKNVLVIEGRVDIRSVIRDTLKDLGIAQIVAASTVQEGWTILEKMAGSPPDWIITNIGADQKVTVFHLLAMILDHPELIKIRVSIVFSENESELLPPAFEMGLLSCHMLPFTKMSLTSALGRLMKGLASEYDQHCHTAAQFLRDNLSACEDYQSLVALEESLLLRFPGVPSCFLKLAEAQMLNGQNDLARRTLWQAKHLGADLKIGVKQLQEMLDAEDSGGGSGTDDQSFAKAFGLSKAIIVDPDNSVVKQITDILKQIGIEETIEFGDGVAAFEWIEKNELPGLIIQEWKLPKLSGAALMQRIVQIGIKSTTLVVCSSLIKRDDSILLKELGVSAMVNKPVRSDEFLASIMSALREDRFPTENSNMERKFRHAVAESDLKMAEGLFAKLMTMNNVPAATLMTLEAELAYAEGKFEKAKEMAQEAIRSKGDGSILLNLLGKIFLRLGDNESAFKCLNHANQFSTKNLERLCLLAEVASEVGESEKAKEILDVAMGIDKNSERVCNAIVSSAINLGDTNKARAVMLSMDSLSNVISYMNNRAVTLARQGKTEESLELYQNALASVPEDRTGERARILYNLGLACARKGDLDQAVAHLEKVESSGGDSIFGKSTSLLTRVRKAKSANTKVQLQVSGQAVKPDLEKQGSGSRPLSLHVVSGQLCLHLLFRSDDKYFKKVEPLINKPPKFTWQRSG